MIPALLGAGMIIGAFGRAKANQDQAAAEEMNAAFYREQAAYAQEVGDRQRKIFEDESELLYGEQQSAFAKAGVDTSSSSYFLAQTMSTRQEESWAIEKETAMNVRLANLRAQSAQATADSLRDPMNQAMTIFGGGLQTAGMLG